MKKILLLVLLTTSLSTIFGQSAVEVLRYSYLQPGGTARYVGAGGAFTALGAEFGGISQNPAGLALFRSNQLVLTPSLRFTNSKTSLSGSNQSDNETKSNFGFDNAGFVFTNSTPDRKWKTFNVAIGLNRQNNYHVSSYYEGNAAGTIVNNMLSDALGASSENDLDPFFSGLAWDTYALFDLTNDGVFNPESDFIGNPNVSLNRNQLVNTYGRMNDLVLAFAGNYDEKLMLGASLNVPFVNYRQESDYREEDAADVVPLFNNLIYTDYLRTEGIGFNAKFGVTYRPVHALLIGASFHTPTFLRLTDTYSASFTYDFNNANGAAESYSSDSPENRFDYRLRTPWRADFGASVIVNKFGFLSADVEIVDYDENRFNLTADVSNTENQRFERELNTDIRRQFKQAVNLRFGGELALDAFRLRGGVNMLGRPQDDNKGDQFNMAYSAGFGVHLDGFYIDLAYRRYDGSGSVQPYAGAPVANTDNTFNDFLLTLGLKF